MSIQRKYYLYEEDVPTGCLYVTYQETGGKTKLSAIQDQDLTIIELAHLCINGVPAQYLKRFNSAILPEAIEDSRGYQKKGSDYFLDFDGKWDWFSEKREIKNIKIQVIWRDNTLFVEVLSCYRMIWVKKFLAERIGQLARNEDYLLYYKNHPLRDEITIDEYGIGENEILEAAVQADLIDGPTSLQMGTGGGYTSIHDFEKYVDQMRLKINIVCQISIPTTAGECRFGTGFLIGDYLIMTNEHVVSSGLQGARVKFFYHATDEKEIELELCEDIVCKSKSPGNHLPRQNKLDYAILRLKPQSDIHAVQLATLQELDAVANYFFQNAYEAFKKKQSPPTTPLAERIKTEKNRLKRANIIQHPLSDGSQPQPKQITFRENRVYESDLLLLHYQSETKPGSSGSPAINDQGEWIGLHYSECTLVQRKLFKHHRKLCEELDFELDESDSDHVALCFTKGDENLYIYTSGESRGLCSNDRGGKKFNLRELILRNSEVVKSGQITLASFILKFLDSQDDPIKEEHIYCNTAIVAENIFRDLCKRENKKQKKLDSASEISKKEWEDFAKSQRPFWKKHKWPLMVGVASVVGLSAIVVINWRKKQSS